MALPRSTHLFGEDTQTALFVLALLPYCIEALAPFCQVRLKFGFLERKCFNHLLEFTTCLCVTQSLRQFCSTLADLMFKFIHSTYETFSSVFSIFRLITRFSEVHLQTVEAGMCIFKGYGMVLACFTRFTSNNLSSSFLGLQFLVLTFKDGLSLGHFIQ